MNNDQPNNEKSERTRRLDAPALFWAAALLAVVNICLVIWFAVSPDLGNRSSANPLETLRSASDAWKPSPFAVAADEQRQAPRNRPAKVRPTPVSTINFIDGDSAYDQPPSDMKPPIGAEVMHTVYEHAPANPADRPQRIADDQRVLHGAQMYDFVEKQTDMPRVTASNYNARPAAANSAHAGTGAGLSR